MILRVAALLGVSVPSFWLSYVLILVFAERDRLWPDGTGTGQRSVGLAFHEAALLEAGFDEVGVVWQDLEERVLMALR